MKKLKKNYGKVGSTVKKGASNEHTRNIFNSWRMVPRAISFPVDFSSYDLR